MAEKVVIESLSPLVLAYVGDSIMEAKVRTRLVLNGYSKINKLHKSAIEYVRGSTQSKLYDYLENFLTPKEYQIMKRGRNAKKNVPKSVGVKDYRKSTGVESLVGYLYLKGEHERLKEILERMYKMVEENIYEYSR